MDRNSRDFDPWKHTVAGRGPEVDTPLDNGYDPGNVFGAAPETVGVPRRVRGVRRTGRPNAMRPMLVLAAVLLLASVVGAVVVTALLNWLG